MKIAVPFSAAYPDEEPKSLNEYLEGISKQKLLKIGAFFLGFKNRSSAYSHPHSFLNMFFSEQNIDEAKRIATNLEQFVAQDSTSLETYEIPYVVSSLSFFEFVFDNIEDDVEDSLSNEEMEKNILKAYLLLNENNTKEKGEIASESTKDFHITRKPASILLSLQLHNNDLTNYYYDKLFSTQLIRAMLFFEFLESQEVSQHLLENFYNKYEVKDYKEYLKRTISLAIIVINSDKEAHTDITIDNPEERKEDIEFLEKFIVANDEVLEDTDYRKIRSTPIYKIEEGKYRIISPMFVIEMIYNGLYWKFRPINDQLPKGQKIKNFYDFKTYDFSEKYVLHRILKEYFGNRYFQKNGEELDAMCSGAPDYYVRNGKRIFLFESKDIMLSAEVKQSSDYSIIEKELVKKLYKKEDDTPKAVIQIIRNVERILKGELEFDSRLKPNRVIVHPILVLHYRMFNVGGLNKVINFWFQDELQKLNESGLDTSRIKPLTIIDVDTLIFNKDVFSSRKLSLEECLSEYQDDYINFTVKGRKYNNEEEAIQANKNSYIPFSSYLDEKIDKLNLRSIPIELKEKGYGIFDA
ncbi:hypothetical protein [Tenacibaculum litopenaei]|uniref:hypothetical protein n=1 Tax=Tenacibaculum litopenaei TaxID=396016 RepID=UPI0038B55F51